jgi:hypothetical protein
VITMRTRFTRRFRLPAAAVLLFALFAAVGASRAEAADVTEVPEVRVVTDAAGSRLTIDGRDVMVFGMNWDYFPIGTNYGFDIWSQPDEFIREALEREMPLLKAMGVNAIRVYAGIPPRWVRYIHERYGIYTMVNHPMARYGYTLDGVWIPSVDYSDPRLRAAVREEIGALVDSFRDTPGVLMWLLGNENNYGLAWNSNEIQALPEGERDAARARHLYSLFGEILRDVKSRDPRRPVAIANGDLQYIDIIARECQGLDVLGTNVYRGISARDLFDVVKEKLGVPVMFTEFGADAFDARHLREDQMTQARYLLGQWREIYEQSSGKGRAGNAIGGFIFQWTDGWWKFGQESRLDIHDTNASWPNDAYPEDFRPGENNMNEEWWGITAKGAAEASGLYRVYPRAAYYALQAAFRLPPYAPSTTPDVIREHFQAIEPAAAALQARGDRAALLGESANRFRVSGLRLELEAISTGGKHVTTPEESSDDAGYPAFRGFDHMESFYADFEARPTDNVTGRLSVNVLGHVPLNPIDEIFYENRGRPRTVASDEGPLTLNDIERVQVYQASLNWEDPWYQLEGFYRTGHFHWGYEGDFFGLYREANYGENIDIYNGVAPVGFEVDFRRGLRGLTVAMGPELWWGANPALFLKYQRKLGAFNVSGLFQEDLDSRDSVATSSSAVPVPPTRKATLHLATTRGRLGIELGGIWSGSNKIGDPVEIFEEGPDDGRLLQDEVRHKDAVGAKARLTYARGRVSWYGQAAWMGAVADGGPTATLTYTGWTLKDSGLGNQANVMSGFAYQAGKLQVAPNVLYQKPIIGPLPADPGGRWLPRNTRDDPFAVRANREMTGAELLLTWDPTPATWFWMWDNDIREDARFAASLGYVFRHLPTTQDAALYVAADGTTVFPFLSATPPRDLWELRSRFVWRPWETTRIVGNVYGGTVEPNGDDPRKVGRFGVGARIVGPDVSFETFARFNDWGPYDYHRDFNLTYPVQLSGDLSRTLGQPRWFSFPQTRLGVKATWRSLDDNSPRYLPSLLSAGDGNEWEIRTYVHLAQ